MVTRIASNRAKLASWSRIRSPYALLHHVYSTYLNAFERNPRLRTEIRTPQGAFASTDPQTIEEVADEFGLGKGKKVLDFGGGKGLAAHGLACFGPQVTAVEISPHLHNIAVEMHGLMPRQVQKRVTLLLGDGLKIDFSKFDLIYFFFTHPSVPEDRTMDAREYLDGYYERFEDKLLRELKPGAKLVVYGGAPKHLYGRFSRLECEEFEVKFAVFSLPK